METDTAAPLPPPWHEPLLSKTDRKKNKERKKRIRFLDDDTTDPIEERKDSRLKTGKSTATSTTSMQNKTLEMPETSSVKPKKLTSEEKVKALELYEKLQSTRKVATEMSVGKTQILKVVTAEQAMTAKPKKYLTLDEKVKALELYEKLQSTRKVAMEMSVGRTQIQNVIIRKAEILKEFEQRATDGEQKAKVGDKRKRRSNSGIKFVNDMTWDWYQDMASRKIPVNGPQLKVRALKIAKEVGNSTFVASNGWLESFQKRHSIVFSTKNG